MVREGKSSMRLKGFRRILFLAAERADSFAAEFDDESDRGLVVLGAAKLDGLLKEILLKTLRPCLGRKKERVLLDQELREFGSRIKACNELGLIDPDLSEILHKLRIMRNKFAHDHTCRLVGGKFDSKIADIEGRLAGNPLYLMVKDMLQKQKPVTALDKPFRLSFEAILFFLTLLFDLYQTTSVKPIYKSARTLTLSPAQPGGKP